MKRVAETLEVSRSRLVERVGSKPWIRPPRYNKAEDEMLLPLIREIIDERPSYGYRRTCAVLNRRLEKSGRPRVNHKRVYRIMRLYGFLLARHSGKRPSRTHEGKVIAIRRNLRWCSDVFELSCANGETVRVAFALDCCDREVIGHVASTRGISGEMVQDLMLECVEKRFKVSRTPHTV